MTFILCNTTYVHSNSFYTIDEVLFLIKSLDLSKANGPDGISAQMLKGTAHSIARSLTKLFNIFPFTKVISLRAGRHLLLFQFRNLHVAVKPPTIALLSIVSKMLERHSHQYITNHLNKYHPLSNKQWGFQSGKSTTTALLSVTHDWFQALEAGQASFLILGKPLILFLIGYWWIN